MTDTKEREDLLIEVLALIDRGLNDMQHRELVSTSEMADLLLDVRSVAHQPSGRGALGQLTGRPSAGRGNQLGVRLLEALPQQIGLCDRARVHVQAHVELAAVRHHRQVERGAPERTERIGRFDQARRR